MSDSSQGNKRILRNTLFLYLRMGIIMVITLYTSRVFLRTLGVVDYGIFNVVAGFVTMFTFLNNAMSSSIQRFFNFEIGKNQGQGVRNVYTTAIYTQLLLSVILIVLLETIGVWYIENKLVVPLDRLDVAMWVFQISVLSVVFVVMGVPFSGAVLAYEKMDFYAIVGIIDVLLKLAIALILPHVGYDKLLVYAVLLLVTSMISFLLYVIYVKRNFNECKFLHKFDKPLFISMLGFSGWHAFSAAGTMMGNQGINMILNLFFGPVVNAARGVSYQVNSAIMGFVRNVTVAARPQMIQSYAEGNIGRSLRLMYGISKISFLSCFLMLLPVCLEIDTILGVWLGYDSVPENTNIFTIWVLCTSLICTLDTPVTTLVHATGNIRNYHLISTVVSLFTLPLGYFVLKYSSTPVLIFVVHFFMVLMGQIVGLFLLKKVFPISIKEYVREVVLPLMLTVLVSLIAPVSLMFMNPGWGRFVLIFVVSIASVLLFSYILGLKQTERQMIIEVVRKRVKK